MLNAAIRLKFSNPNSWHFLALYHKEEKNYNQAMKCYLQAIKNDPSNFNVIRDLSYLQLYLRQYLPFLETAKKGVDQRPGLVVNWVTYSFANYLTKNYEFAFKLLDSCEKINPAKPQEKNEIILFQAHILKLQNKELEGIEFLENNKKYILLLNLFIIYFNLFNFPSFVLDKTLYHEKIISFSRKFPEKYDFCLEKIEKALEINSENLSYFLAYMEVNYNKKLQKDESTDANNTKKIQLEKFEDLLNVAKNPEISKELITCVLTLKNKYKSRVISRIEMALLDGEEFKNLIKEYLAMQIKSGIPSIFINLKFIYNLQSHKIEIINDIINELLNDLEKNKKISIKKSKKDQKENDEFILIDLVPEFIWLYFFAAHHFYFLGNMEKALYFINLALDKTPTVVEFYMLKSKIFEHSGLLDKSADAYEKAKKLDLGDRYLNAKYAKKYVRQNNLEKANEIMKEFVRDPLIDENIDHVQCMWYETECAFAYLRNKNLLRAHRLFSSMIFHFTTIVEDQV